MKRQPLWCRQQVSHFSCFSPLSRGREGGAGRGAGGEGPEASASTRPFRRLSILFLLLAALPALAAAQRWTPFGPAAWPLTGFAAGASGRIFVASGADGVFASADGGRAWSFSGIGMGAARIQALAADADGDLFASGPAAFFGSTDDGRSWSVLSKGLPLGPPDEAGDLLAVAPGGAGGPQIFLARGPVLLRSDDGGATWQQALVQPLPFRALLVDPNVPRSVFAATAQGGGLFHSGDGGVTWEPVTDVEPASTSPFDEPFSFGVLGLAAAPTSPTTFFAEMNLNLYRSTDGGVSWRLLPPTPAPSVGFVYAVTVVPGSPPAVVTLQQLVSADGAGIFASHDLGETWKRVDAVPDGHVPFGDRLIAAPSGDLYVLAPQILAHGGAGGAHWTTSLEVFDCSRTASSFGLLRWPGDGSRIYAEVTGGLAVSGDGGRSWIGRQAPVCMGDFRVDPGHASTLYAGAQGGVYASRNSGATWKSILTAPDPRFDFTVKSLAVPKSGRIVAGECGIWLSVDAGSTWRKTLGCAAHHPDGDYARDVQKLFVDPVRPDVLYAKDVEVSEQQHPPRSLAFILRSTDGGRTWHPLVASFGTLAIDPHTPQTLYLLEIGQIRRSMDDGRTWQTISAPGPGVAQYDLLVDPRDSRTLYASGSLGVFRSHDGGVTWQPFGTGLAGRIPVGLFLDPGDRNLFTGTGGLFQMRLR